MRSLQTLGLLLLFALHAHADYPAKKVPVPKFPPAEQAPLGSLAPAGQLRAAVFDLATRVPERDKANTRYISMYAVPADKLRAWTILLQFLLNTASYSDALAYPDVVPGTGGRLVRVRLTQYRWVKDAFVAVARRDPYFRATELPTREAEFARQVIGVAQDPKTLAAELIVEGTFLMRDLAQTDERSETYYDLLFGFKRFDPANAVVAGEPILPPAPGPEPPPPTPSQWPGDKPWTDGKLYPGGFPYVPADVQAKYELAHAQWLAMRQRREEAAAAVPLAKAAGGLKKNFPANVAEWEKFFGVADANKFGDDQGIVVRRGEVAIGGRNVKGMKGSWVAYNDRVIAINRIPTGFAFRTYDSLNTKRNKDFLERPLDVINNKIEFDAGELLAHLPNGLQAALLINGKGDRVEFADSRAARNTQDADVTVRTQVGCLQCHAPESGFISPTSRKFKESIQAGLKLNVKQEEEKLKAEAFLLSWEEEEKEYRGKYGRALAAATRAEPKNLADKGWTGAQLVAVLLEFRDWYDNPVEMEQASAYLGYAPLQLFPVLTLSPTAGLNLIAVGKGMPRSAWDETGVRDAQLLLALLRLPYQIAFRIPQE